MAGQAQGPAATAATPSLYPLTMRVSSQYEAYYAPAFSWGHDFQVANAVVPSFARCASVAFDKGILGVIFDWDSATGNCIVGKPIVLGTSLARVSTIGAVEAQGDFIGLFDLQALFLGNQTSLQPCLDKCTAYVGTGWCALVVWYPDASAFSPNCYLKV
ncbi:hypothetical protein HDU98_008993 [Podochytrium sp. JEL0797]|nr:hypothetical protein HDU98_008993 [Podochytrium sp. JEL0797]